MTRTEAVEYLATSEQQAAKRRVLLWKLGEQLGVDASDLRHAVYHLSDKTLASLLELPEKSIRESLKVGLHVD